MVLCMYIFPYKKVNAQCHIYVIVAEYCRHWIEGQTSIFSIKEDTQRFMNSKWVQNCYEVAFYMLSDLALMRLQKGHNFGYLDK